MRHLAAWCICLVIACGAAPAGEPSYLIRVERRGAGDLAILSSAGLPVVQELDTCLLLEGTQESLAWLGKRGYEAGIIDLDPQRWDYLVAGLRPDSSFEALQAAGTVILAEGNWALLRVPPQSSIEALDRAQAFIARVPHEPVEPPRVQAPLFPLPARAADGEAPAFTGGDPGFIPGTAGLPLVQQIASSVSTTQINQFWTDLTTNSPTGTRYSSAQGCRDAATYCYNKYVSYGIPAQYQNWSTARAPNVIGTLEGAVNPADVFIVIGHLDDLPSSGSAPGADDNASGSVNVLESARVLGCYAFRNTVKFINCTGEEQGLLGSAAYAADAASRGENILGVLNMDMIGWAGNGTPNPENLDLNYNDASQDLGLRFAQAAKTYNTGLVVDAFLCPSLTASDHAPFWQRGWKAVCGITDNEGYCSHAGNYPYYHRSTDTIANNGKANFFYSVVRTSVATLAELAQPFRIAFDQELYTCGGGADHRPAGRPGPQREPHGR